MEYNTLLPLGTIITLGGTDKKVMIIGVCPQSKEKDGSNVISDYIGVMYPEGYLSADMFFVFNRSDINEVLFEGYRGGDEWKEFLTLVEGIVDKKEGEA